jgi:HK97 family phage major capsid protein
MTKKELERKIEDERAALKKMLDDAVLAKRDLTPAETMDFDTRYRELQRCEVELDQMPGDVYMPDFNAKGSRREAELFGRARTWEQIWRRDPKPLAHKLSLGEIAVAVKLNDVEKLRELRTMAEGSGSTGGFAVPEQLWRSIYNSALEESVVLDLLTVFAMDSDKLLVAAWDSEDHTAGPIGGVVGQWLAEAGTAARVTPAMRQLSFEAVKLAMYIAVTSEAAQDIPSLSQSLALLMRNSLAWSIDDVVINGNGMGKPLGILPCPARVNQLRAVANQIALADLAGMFGKLLPTSVKNAVWLMNPSAFAYALNLTTAAGQLVLTGAPGASAAVPMTLFGRPIRITEKCAALGSEGDVILADLSYYGLATRETGRFEATNAAQWTQDILDYRLIWRLNGQPMIKTPLKPAKGTTLSPFVALK